MIVLRLAARNLAVTPRRTGLLAALNAVLCALVVLALSGHQGIRDRLLVSTTCLSSGHVNVTGYYKERSSGADTLIVDASRIRAVLERTPGLDHAVARHRTYGTLSSGTATVRTELVGARPDELSDLMDCLRPATTGEYVPDGDDRVEGDVAGLDRGIVLFAGQAKTLGVRVGDALVYRSNDEGRPTNTADLTVVSVVREIGPDSGITAFAPAEVVQEVAQVGADTASVFWLYLQDPDDAEAIVPVLRQLLEREGAEVLDHSAAPYWRKQARVAGEDWVGQRLDLTTWRDESAHLGWALLLFDVAAASMLAVLLSAVSAGILALSWYAVTERVAEIGTLRAIGMSRPRVTAMVLAESGLLALGASSVGMLAAVALSAAVDAAGIPIGSAVLRTILVADVVELGMPPWGAALVVPALALIAIGAALVPAVRAARLPPATAIRRR